MDSFDSRRGCAGIVLAGGLSSRFGRRNKLLLPIAGEPLVRRVVSAFLGAALDPVEVVVGHDALLLEDALCGLPITIVRNSEYALGQSSSLIRGVASLPPGVEAAVIGVADQPGLSADVVRSLISAWSFRRPLVVAPRFGGRRGNPVLFDRRLFSALLRVTGDRGGREVIEQNASRTRWIDVPDTGMGADVDTEEEYRRLTRER